MTESGDGGALEGLERAFHELRRLDTASRAARLDELAVDSPELVQELEPLLRAHDGAALVDEPPMADRHPATVDLRTGDVVGGYILERIIGTGGMGTVWRARQLRPRRSVALKLVRSGFGAQPAHRRFAREAGIMATLQHPGIARIYEAGETETPAGSIPFYAMELIDGVPLDQYAVERKLTTGQRLELFTAVCDAVAHANARGVVHRDLKPDNILVSEDGHPKILDFGVARAVDLEGTLDTMLTTAGQLVGTLAYMSPEQTLGDPDAIDQRADVYSLGVILYELVSGRRPLPLSGKPPLEALEIIRNEEPARLGSVDLAWRGDLSVIQAKSMEKEPERRYPGASELADDLRRYLSDRTITARPAGVGYRLGKLIRRNKIAVGAASVVVVSLVTGLLAALSGQHEAEASAREAQAALERYQGIVGFLDETLAAVDPVLSGRRHVTLESYVDEVARGLALRFPDDEEARIVLETTIGRAYSGLERYEDARRHLQAALASRRRNLGREHPLIAESLFQLARNDASARNLDAAQHHITDALDVLAASGTEVGELPRQCWTLAGYIAFLSSDFARARQHLQRARAAAEKLTWDLTWIEAKIDIVEGDLERGIAGMEASAKTLAETFGADHPRVAELTMEIAECEFHADRLQESESTARRALDMLKDRFGSPFAVVLRNHGVLGRILIEQGRLPEAEEHLRKVLARNAELDHPESFTTSTRLALGSILMRRGSHEEARDLVTSSIRSLRNDFPEGNHVLASALLLAAREAMTRRDPTEALDLARESWSMGQEYPVADIDLRAGSELARLQQAMRNRDEAISVMREVCDIALRRHGAKDPRSMSYRVLLGSFLFDDQRMEEAVEALAIVDDLAALASSRHAFSVALGRRSLGGALLHLGDYDRGEKELLAAFDASEAQGPAGSRIFASAGRLLLDLYDELEDDGKKSAIRRRLAANR